MNDKRLIYADEVIRGMEEIMNSPWFKDDRYTLPVKKDAFYIVKNLCVDSAPTIDAVEVVRCRKCYYRDKPSCCPYQYSGFKVEPDWYCPMGVKMDAKEC